MSQSSPEPESQSAPESAPQEQPSGDEGSGRKGKLHWRDFRSVESAVAFMRSVENKSFFEAVAMALAGMFFLAMMCGMDEEGAADDCIGIFFTIAIFGLVHLKVCYELNKSHDGKDFFFRFAFATMAAFLWAIILIAIIELVFGLLTLAGIEEARLETVKTVVQMPVGLLMWGAAPVIFWRMFRSGRGKSDETGVNQGVR